ncbi:MAG: endonuclease/exonuclease/phosphatase family protein [Bacteroidota bacterium]|nr:endonuclease/exonuclease/phosphatase family protein [Bacteroidota bacterium]
MKFINTIVWILNWIIAILLIGSYLSRYVDPGITTIFAFLGLAYPVLLVINIVFIVWWIVFRYKRLILSLIVILIGFGYIGNLWNPTKKTVPENEQEDVIKVMSYNVKLFGLYDWKNNKEIRDSIFNFLGREQPDIVCFQEYFISETGYFPTRSKLVSVLDAKNLHEGIAIEAQQKQKFGMASYLKYPIVNKGEFQFSNSKNMFIFTDFLWEGDTVRLYNIHLQSIYFDDRNYQDVDANFLTDIDKERLKGYNSIRRKLSFAFKQRAKQAEVVGEHIEKSPYPVIVCGDFNDTPVSYAYHKVGKSLCDGFKKAGHGLALSYERKYLRVRIDHILYSNDFTAYEFNVHKIGYSDHFPVSCYLNN